MKFQHKFDPSFQNAMFRVVQKCVNLENAEKLCLGCKTRCWCRREQASDGLRRTSPGRAGAERKTRLTADQRARSGTRPQQKTSPPISCGPSSRAGLCSFRHCSFFTDHIFQFLFNFSLLSLDPTLGSKLWEVSPTTKKETVGFPPKPAVHPLEHADNLYYIIAASLKPRASHLNLSTLLLGTYTFRMGF